jgi:prepilin-type N-terminal cleavage/methylation domain-containing protein
LRHCSPEAGFSLVEVLAALAIASMAVVMAMQVLLQSARVDARLTHETAARDLTRRLMAEGAVGQGETGVLLWHVALTPQKDGLVLRQVQVSWPGGPVLETDRVELQP